MIHLKGLEHSCQFIGRRIICLGIYSSLYVSDMLKQMNHKSNFWRTRLHWSPCMLLIHLKKKKKNLIIHASSLAKESFIRESDCTGRTVCLRFTKKGLIHKINLFENQTTLVALYFIHWIIRLHQSCCIFSFTKKNWLINASSLAEESFIWESDTGCTVCFWFTQKNWLLRVIHLGIRAHWSHCTVCFGFAKKYRFIRVIHSRIRLHLFFVFFCII